jgi:hypothetical protein
MMHKEHACLYLPFSDMVAANDSATLPCYHATTTQARGGTLVGRVSVCDQTVIYAAVPLSTVKQTITTQDCMQGSGLKQGAEQADMDQDTRV